MNHLSTVRRLAYLMSNATHALLSAPILVHIYTDFNKSVQFSSSTKKGTKISITEFLDPIASSVMDAIQNLDDSQKLQQFIITVQFPKTFELEYLNSWCI